MKMAEWGRVPQGQHRARLCWLPRVRHDLSVRMRDGLREGGMRGHTEQSKVLESNQRGAH